MANFGSVNEALDFAIQREEEAYVFYTDLAGRMKKAGMSDIFKQFALEEKGHKAKLLQIKKGKKLQPAKTKIADLKIGDYLVDVMPSSDMSYQDALILAMKKEKAAFRMYTDLAASAPTKTLKNAFLALAQEEAKHKLRFEVAYDEEILTEN